MPRRPAPLPLLPTGLDGRLRPTTVFSTTAAHRAGVSRARLAASDLTSLGRGLWRVRDRPLDPLDLLRALQDLHPHAAFSHATAAVVLGLWLPDRWSAVDPVHLSVPAPRSTRLERPGVELHRRASLTPTTVVDGVRIVDPVWTFVDLAALLPTPEDVVVLGDSLVRTAPTARRRAKLPPGVVGWDCVRAGVEARAGARGVRRARAAMEWMRPGADSPQESRTRLRLVAAGLPEPEVNPAVRLSTGQVLRVDLAWPQWKVAVEYDGPQHLSDPKQVREDAEREQALRAEGWEVVRVRSGDLTTTAWELILWQVRSFLRAQGAPV